LKVNAQAPLQGQFV